MTDNTTSELIDFGTPRQAERMRRIRRLRIYRRIFCAAMIILSALVTLIVCRNVGADREPIRTGLDYHTKAAMLPQDKLLYVTDPHEGCLVMMHKDVVGPIEDAVVASHC